MNEIPGWFMPLVGWAPESLQTVAWIVAQIMMIMLPLIITVAMFTYAERKVVGYIQGRIGPNRVNLPIIGGLLRGWGQPFADVLKLLQKEVIFPTQSSRFLFILAPVLSLAPAFAAWAVMPLSPEFVLADINAGLLYILAMTSLGIYGIILSGWASNSKYAFLGAMRSAAQMIAYEIAMGFALVGVLMASGTLNMGGIIEAQRGGPMSWFWLPLLPLFFVYFISGLAETNRLPFDMAEGESEIVAGFHVEYSGTAFAAFFLAEYANMILISALTAVFFFGGWLSPFESWTWMADVPVLGLLTEGSFLWFAIKTGVFMFAFLWIRGTFPRYRYDQIMRLGWKVFIPVTLVWITLEGIMAYLEWGPWA